jgi:CheY-like chemotaxis protein
VQTYLRPLRILVIDDCADEAHSLAELVGFWGQEAHIALNGITGLVEANDFRPDVVLCDLTMPGIDGCKVAESLRHHAALSDSLLVAVTAHSDNDHRRRAARAGFHAYLVKPIEPDDLQRLVDSQLKNL